MFAMHPVQGPVNSVRVLREGNRAARTGLVLLYRKNGLHITPSHGFMSTAYTDEDVTRLIEMYNTAVEELRVQGMW